jgi:hypothetical protein
VVVDGTAADKNKELAMNWPDWLTEERATLVASSVAAVSAVVAAVVGALAYRSSNRRKKPIFEIAFQTRLDTPAGWRHTSITVRNIEVASVELSEIRVVPKGAAIAQRDAGFEANGKPWDEPSARGSFEKMRKIELSGRIAPRGQTTIGEEGMFSDAVTFTFLTRGVDKITDLRFGWHWSDRR